jgi:hypothetical protein
MEQIPSDYPPYLTTLVQKFIETDKYKKKDIELMIEQYKIVNKRIAGIKIQGDLPNEWWDPNSIQLEVINSFIFEIIGPYYVRSYLSFYHEETHGPYIVSNINYKIFLDLNFPNFKLYREKGKNRRVEIFILPQHNGAE